MRCPLKRVCKSRSIGNSLAATAYLADVLVSSPVGQCNVSRENSANRMIDQQRELLASFNKIREAIALRQQLQMPRPCVAEQQLD